MTALNGDAFVVLDGDGRSPVPGDHLVLVRGDSASESAIAAAPSVLRFAGAGVVCSRPAGEPLPGFDGLSAVRGALAVPVSGAALHGADVRSAVRAYAAFSPKTPTARALLAAADAAARFRGDSGRHACWLGCDGCSDEDCRLRVPGVVPGCGCPCHRLCYRDAGAEHVRSSAWLPTARGRAASVFGAVYRLVGRALGWGGPAFWVLRRSMLAVGDAACPESSGADRCAAISRARRHVAQAASLPRGEPMRTAVRHAAEAALACAVMLHETSSPWDSAEMDAAAAAGRSLWRGESLFEASCVAALREAGEPDPNGTVASAWGAGRNGE